MLCDRTLVFFLQSVPSPQYAASSVIDLFNKWSLIFQGYPSSVTPDYVSFQVWDSLQGLSTYIRSMISTQVSNDERSTLSRMSLCSNCSALLQLSHAILSTLVGQLLIVHVLGPFVQVLLAGFGVGQATKTAAGATFQVSPILLGECLSLRRNFNGHIKLRRTLRRPTSTANCVSSHTDLWCVSYLCAPTTQVFLSVKLC